MDYDILIIGGGMVGASLAIALRDLPLKVGVVEAVPLDDQRQPSFDARGIALSHGSRVIFEGMGLWQAIAMEGISPIRHIRVSDRGHFGTTRIDAAEEGVEALGYVAEALVLGRALSHALAETPNAELICPARFVSLMLEDEVARVTLDENGSERTLTARLVVAADGGRSAVREQVGGKTLKLGYGQSAVISTVLTDRSHRDTAYERFTDTGPLAMLPCDPPAGSTIEGAGHRWSMVWSARDNQVKGLLEMPEAEFIARLQRRLGQRAGTVMAIGKREAYPLSMQYLYQPVRPRLAFVGNAAHSIHPVGGQGFNLGLRDVAALAEVIADNCRRGGDIGHLEALRRYADWRKPDYYRVMGFTDILARGFSSRFPPLVVARNLGMLAMDMLPPARRLFTRQAMGLSGRLPRLARGLRL